MSFSWSPPNYFNETDWSNTDTSQFLWDSPQPEHQSLSSSVPQQPADPALLATPEQEPSNGSSTAKTLPHRTAQAKFSVPSGASETSSHSSSSGSSARKKRKASSTASPQLFSSAALDSASLKQEPLSSDFRIDKMFEGNDDAFQFDDPVYPSMGQDMNNLSLNAISHTRDASFGWDSSCNSPDAINPGLFTDRSSAFSSQAFPPSLRATSHVNASPQMTIQPSKTFFFGDSSANSPESISMMQSHENSPSANNAFPTNSPLPNNSTGFGHGYSKSSPNTAMVDSSTPSFGLGSSSASTEQSPTGSTSARPYAAWPCHLEIEPMPEKSRVETQIPIKLTLHNPPRGAQRLHLPAHTISKPKFQAKPPLEKSSDILELSAMLVCASAMEKPGVEESAFKRAAADDIYVESEENQPASVKVHNDENNPVKPLNGGPVAICSGCIARERKRAARKKTKKADEEEEWLKDEAKRVIVFNCPEMRDWCVPGTKETTVKEHDMPLDSIFVNAPMRIACYCRHQNEKTGFKVLFTIRSPNGAILAQNITQSIMITDDHKQPTSNSQSSNMYQNSQMGGAFYQGGNGFGMHGGAFPQPMPFRNSFSTNDLRQLGNQYAPQRRPQTLSRADSGNETFHASTVTSTATATPRNLSRPASPTNQSGPTKKRRSGGPGHKKMPSGLTMTRMEEASSSGAAGSMSAGPISAGPMNTAFSFSPTGMGNFGSGLDTYQSPPGTSNPFQGGFQSGPATPSHGPSMPAFATSFESDPFFYSAPTSQHPSRPPSPGAAARSGFPAFGSNSQSTDQAPPNALARLPAGFNLQRPPFIQRVIPTMGPVSGGDDITVLGNGFFQGLEVMFGDHVAINTVFWGDTTLVCRAPPGNVPGMVQVLFKHQHHSSGLSRLRGILPTQPVYYEYFDDDRTQLQMLAVGAAQGHSTDLTQISQEELSRAFLNASGGFSNFQSGMSGGSTGNQRQRPVSAVDLARLTDAEFETLLLSWLDARDMSPSPYAPRYNKKTRTGATLLSLAAGRGYTRFCAGLLARGANPNSRDLNGFTALMMASMRGFWHTKWLLEVKGADPALRTLGGLSAADLVSPSQASSPFSKARLPMVDLLSNNDVLRRPSSAPSLESLSGLSSTSQPSPLESGLETSEVVIEASPSQKLVDPNFWGKHQEDGDHLRHNSPQAYYSACQALASLPGLRELMLGQMLHLQQTMLAAFGMPNLQLPRLSSLPQSINKLDYQQYYEQYPMVRRISEFLSPISSHPGSAADSTHPPAYDDIFPPNRLSGSPNQKCGEMGESQDRTNVPTSSRKAEKFERSQALEHRVNCKCRIDEQQQIPKRFDSSDDTDLLVDAELGVCFPWVLLFLAISYGIWNYTNSEAFAHIAPVTRLRGLIQATRAI